FTGAWSLSHSGIVSPFSSSFVGSSRSRSRCSSSSDGFVTSVPFERTYWIVPTCLYGRGGTRAHDVAIVDDAIHRHVGIGIREPLVAGARATIPVDRARAMRGVDARGGKHRQRRAEAVTGEENGPRERSERRGERRPYFLERVPETGMHAAASRLPFPRTDVDVAQPVAQSLRPAERHDVKAFAANERREGARPGEGRDFRQPASCSTSARLRSTVPSATLSR